jgi:hypothetical protein
MRSISFFLACVLALSLYAQDSTALNNKFKMEVLFNVSDAVARGTGNSNTTTFLTDPILLGVKVKRENSENAFRWGTNFYFIGGDEFINSFQRISKNEYYSMAIGVERRKDIGRTLQYFYGVDARYHSIKSVSQIFFINSQQQTISAVQNGPGIAPVLGFRWQINNRMALFTEGSISLDFINNYRYLSESGQNKQVLEDKLEFTIRPVMPGAIFFTFQL